MTKQRPRRRTTQRRVTMRPELLELQRHNELTGKNERPGILPRFSASRKIVKVFHNLRKLES